MKDQTSRRPYLRAMALAALAPGLVGSAAAQLELSQAELFFELNETDGDLGFHAAIDGDAYTRLEIEGPDGRRLLRLSASGALARQGMTQFALESAEPDFDELAPEAFFERFPEGPYEIEIKHRRDEAEAVVFVSHVLAAPPSGITINDQPAAQDCDADELPVVSAPVLVRWDPVTTSHPSIGAFGPVDIARYQFFAEQDEAKLAMDLPPTVTEFEIPVDFTATGGIFKYEIIARADNLNNTAVESCFIVGPL
ncbi:MAG: hypothetical protein KDH15_06045 [Rhodocyclaceae bacterium]|nr:hypothetical protein [Rhodocyclaceae bacterium]